MKNAQRSTLNAQRSTHCFIDKFRLKFIAIALALNFLTTSQLIAQQTPLDSINLNLRQLFGNLQLPSPPRLFNLDMSAHFLDENLFVKNNTDTIDADTWVGMYEEMYWSAYDTLPLKKIDNVFWPTLNYGPDTVNIMLMYYDYYTFKPDAIGLNILSYFNIDTVNNKLKDKFPRPSSPYNGNTVFAVAPNITQTRNSKVVYRLGLDNMFYDQFNKLDNSNNNILELDFGDGIGLRQVNLGQNNYFDVTYTSLGPHFIKARITKGIGSDPIASSTSSISNKDDFDWENIEPDRMLISPGLNVGVYDPCDGTPPSQIKTIIYLEGIDVLDFTKGISKTITDIYGAQIWATGLADLRNFGYRFVVVDWQNSRLDMRDNAKNVRSLIDQLKCLDESMKNQEQYVIIGESMGGIVARIAMIEMEKEQLSYCNPEKEHNTRLLITLDAPHQGAHLPMGMQEYYSLLRNTAGAALGAVVGAATGASSAAPGALLIANPLAIPPSIGNLIAGSSLAAGSAMVGAAIGMPLGVIGTKIYFVANNLFLDSDAAKQMLISHVSTRSNPSPGSFNVPKNYTMHKKRRELLDELDKKGNYPKHTKLFAISNGNMMLEKQTRLWDGAPRLDNDTLINVNSDVFVRILGIPFKFAKLNFRVNTDPNGTGSIAAINASVLSFKLKMTFQGLKVEDINTNNNVFTHNWQAANMKPITNEAGGIYDPYEGYKSGIKSKLNNDFSYLGQGVWQTKATKSRRLGLKARFKTDGLHFNFVPVSSALDNNPKRPFDALTTADIIQHSPFDVSMGWQGDTLMGTPTINPDYLNINIYLRNRLHTDMRNDTLFLNQGDKKPSNAYYYKTECTGSGNTDLQHPIKMLNREIGDNELYLENRLQPWKGAYAATNDIFVNIRSPFYNYATQPSSVTTLRSVHSKDNPFEIGNAGFAAFNTYMGSLFYDPPRTGGYGQFSSGVGMCCNSYNRSSNPTLSPKITCSIYPNPNAGQFELELQNAKDPELSYTITDVWGRRITQKQLSIAPMPKINIPIALPPSTSPGIYFIQINNTHTLKLIIQ